MDKSYTENCSCEDIETCPHLDFSPCEHGYLDIDEIDLKEIEKIKMILSQQKEDLNKKEKQNPSEVIQNVYC